MMKLTYSELIVIVFKWEDGRVQAGIDGKVYGEPCKTEADALLSAITIYTNEMEREKDNGTD